MQLTYRTLFTALAISATPMVAVARPCALCAFLSDLRSHSLAPR